MKKLSEVYEGIKFFTRDWESDKFFGVPAKDIEREINLVGFVTFSQGEEFSPDEWSTNYEDFYVSEETFNGYDYVLTEMDIREIINAHDDQLDAIGIEDYGEFMQLESLPNEIHDSVLKMIKEKNSKDHLSDFFEDVYNYHDGRNYKKISLRSENGYCETRLDYNVSESIEKDCNNGYIKYFFTDTNIVLKEWIPDYSDESDEINFFTVLSVLEEKGNGEILKELHDLAVDNEDLDEETKGLFVKMWKKIRLKEVFK